MVPNPKPEKNVKIATKKATKEMMIRSIDIEEIMA